MEVILNFPDLFITQILYFLLFAEGHKVNLAIYGKNSNMPAFKSLSRFFNAEFRILSILILEAAKDESISTNK